MKQAKGLFRMDLHRSVYCLNGDGEIRSPWTVYFDPMRRF